jgi:hypothetical protein
MLISVGRCCGSGYYPPCHHTTNQQSLGATAISHSTTLPVGMPVKDQAHLLRCCTVLDSTTLLHPPRTNVHIKMANARRSAKVRKTTAIAAAGGCLVLVHMAAASTAHLQQQHPVGVTTAILAAAASSAQQPPLQSPSLKSCSVQLAITCCWPLLQLPQQHLLQSPSCKHVAQCDLPLAAGGPCCKHAVQY